MKETWKDIKGYEGLYQVSDLGRVKSVERAIVYNNGAIHTVKDRILKPEKVRNGYLHVVLCKNRVTKAFSIHRLVAEAFIPNDDLFADTVNHKDEDKTNNVVSNLEWMSQCDNVRYSQRDGGPGDCRGSKSPNAKPVRCIETGQVFGCARDASRWLGFSKKAVNQSIRNGHCAGGYHWQYLNDNTGLCNG